MRTKILYLVILLFGCWFGAFSSSAPADDRSGTEVDTTSVSYGKFGKITVYVPSGTPNALVLFVSGDGGWKGVITTMAKTLAGEGAMVLGIDARHYSYYLSKRTSDCLYPAADFEELSLSIQQKYKFANYYKPVLAGYSYGAVLVYGILAQAPANTFKGAISLGFSPDINLKKPMCKGNGLTQHVLKPGISFYLERCEKLTAPFLVLNGVKDQTCPYGATEAFMKGLPNAELVPLKVGHGFAAVANWQSELLTAYKKITDATAFANIKMVNNLPLNVVSSLKKNNLPFIFMISGDGGWTSFDQSLAESLAAEGLTVVGLDAQKYFWKEKTPNGAAEDIAKVIIQYRSQLGKDEFVLAGYSFGGSVVPFIASRLPAGLKSKLKAVVSLSPDETADFEIHISDMLNIGGGEEQYYVIPEFKKLGNIPHRCYFGSEEDGDARKNFSKNGINTGVLRGNHHFNDDFDGISRSIVKVFSD
jgi:type IV secretory pathway VirJ component